MRYAVIKTQKKPDDSFNEGPTHWLMRGTLVRILAESEYGTHVETLYPVFGVGILDYPARYEVREQHINPDDYYEIPGQFGPMLESWAELFQRVREWLCIA